MPDIRWKRMALLSSSTITFSGHETFVLRSNWLKKAYDLLQDQPDLFAREDCFARLGVGKNMAQSIRFWGRVCGVFERTEDSKGHRATWLGQALLDDHNGWDPFLVTPTSHWLLHWQIVRRPEVAFTWYFTFNLLRRGEFTIPSLAQQILTFVAQYGGKAPSDATLSRDIDCMLRCYVQPDAIHLKTAVEDALYCPLHTTGLIQSLPNQQAYYLVSGTHPNLSDHLVALASFHQARMLKRKTVSFAELAYGERSPGRIFRLDEDALLARLLRLEQVTAGRAVYNESAGIRQIAWRNLDEEEHEVDRALLKAAFNQEHAYAE